MEKIRRIEKVTGVIVTYNSEKTIEKTLQSMQNIKSIVVDNNSKDNTIKYVEKFKNVEIIKNKKNVGYARAANQGIARINSPFVFLVNPDVVLKKDSVQQMVGFMEKHKDCQVQGPKMVDEKNSLVYSCRRFPAFKSVVGNRFGIFRKAVDQYLMKDYNHKDPRVVDWVSGGCMMFRPMFRFDEHFFLYMEDVDLCTGKKVWYNPSAVVVHSPQYGSRLKLRLLMYHIISYIRYALKIYVKKSNL